MKLRLEYPAWTGIDALPVYNYYCYKCKHLKPRINSMDFLTALNLVFHEEEKIRRTSWVTEPETHFLLFNGVLSIKRAGNDPVPLQVGEADFFATDWETLSGKGPILEFNLGDPDE